MHNEIVENHQLDVCVLLLQDFTSAPRQISLRTDAAGAAEPLARLGAWEHYSGYSCGELYIQRTDCHGDTSLGLAKGACHSGLISLGIYVAHAE